MSSMATVGVRFCSFESYVFNLATHPGRKEAARILDGTAGMDLVSRIKQTEACVEDCRKAEDKSAQKTVANSGRDFNGQNKKQSISKTQN